jgi:cytochrome P450
MTGEHRRDSYFQPQVPSHIDPARVYDFNIYDPEFEDLDLYASLTRLHTIGLPDIFWTRCNGGHWVAHRADIIGAILKDPSTFSSVRALVPEEQNFSTDFFVPLMIDPPAHTVYRKIATTLFAPRRIMSLEQAIRAQTVALLEACYARGHCEFMADVSLQMPVVVFLNLLDLPVEDRLPLFEIATRFIGPPLEGQPRDLGLQMLFSYLEPIIESRRTNPGGDFISLLIQATKDNGDRLTREELYGMTSVLLIGGLDTTASTLGFMLGYLAQFPDQRRRLAADHHLIRNAAEEMVRRFGVTTSGRRITRDITLGSANLKANERILWSAAMYNLDDRLVEDPLTVNFDRKRIVHASFGSGIHFCLGSMLARLEFTVFLEEWLTRIPEFWVKTAALPLKYRPGIITSYRELPLEWNVQ